MHVTGSLPAKPHLGQIDQDVRTNGAILDLSSVLFTLNQLGGACETPRSDNSEHMSSMQLDERQMPGFQSNQACCQINSFDGSRRLGKDVEPRRQQTRHGSDQCAMNTGVSFPTHGNGRLLLRDLPVSVDKSEALAIRSPRGHFTCHLRVEHRTMSWK